MKIQQKIYPIVNSVIRILLLLIVAGMCLQSVFSTSFIGVITQEDGSLQERTLNIADQPWKHLLLFIAFTVAGVLVYKVFPYLGERLRNVFRKVNALTGGRTKRSSQAGAVAIGSFVVLIMGTVWIFVTRLYPGSDPAKVYQIAMQWRRGDFSAYAEGGYLFRYPFQAGIILFYYLLSFLFGIDNYIGLQFINVIALAATYGLLVKLAGLFWQEDEKLPSMVYAALILWVPLSFYVTYLYGILPGMALSLGAVYFAAKYLHTRRYRYILPAALCMGLATVIKMNCLIYLVAIACFLFYDALDITLLTKKELGKQWIVSLLCLVLMGFSVAGCNKLCSRYVEELSGYKAGEGEVMVSWIVMGLQETPLGPGGYSGYINEIFERYDYDTEKITEASIADIKSIMTKLSENPLDEGIPFFARKNAFQWNDPTFISLDRTKGRKAAGSMPAYAHSMIEGKGSVTLSILLNYAQTLILIGMILYLILDWKSRNIYELMGAVVFLGGYLFHFFWESSASYTIPYFVIIIPYAVKGLEDWVRCTDEYIRRVSGAMRRNKGQEKHGEESGTEKPLIMRKKHIWIPSFILLVLVILTALFSRTNLFRRTIALNDGEAAEEQFYHRGENNAVGVRTVAGGILEGYYYLSPYLAQDTALITQNGKMTLVSVMPSALDDGHMMQSVEDKENGSFVTDGWKAEQQDAVTKVSKVKDIENKILLWKESDGVCMRFRSNERVLAADRSGDEPTLTTYLDDGMNSFYEPREEMAYHWKIRSAEGGGYYITIDDLALTYRDGELTLEQSEESDDQKWILQP
ncbi:MAG: hypothetical protein HDR09_15025 [Lachnospiraceae bacterium]|nr:hypothetical protein [Lachnospiraceae bacterium]